ncbi:hypothetical protein FRB93_002618 [Tulasnella sp. JGI-2019a]|nr:hypothetical protein FRB93_002618 [Tulasnella sp. JGI-2019a]
MVPTHRPFSGPWNLFEVLKRPKSSQPAAQSNDRQSVYGRDGDYALSLSLSDAQQDGRATHSAQSSLQTQLQLQSQSNQADGDFIHTRRESVASFNSPLSASPPFTSPSRPSSIHVGNRPRTVGLLKVSHQSSQGQLHSDGNRLTSVYNETVYGATDVPAENGTNVGEQKEQSTKAWRGLLGWAVGRKQAKRDREMVSGSGDVGGGGGHHRISRSTEVEYHSLYRLRSWDRV